MKPGQLTKAEVERYSRQLVLPEMGPSGQAKLKGSSVIVVGAGGLGIPASVYLAAAGVGRIGIVDGDVVEKSNLHRQVIYSEADVGRPKAEVARRRLEKVNPNVSVVPHALRLDSTNALKILGEYDVVLDCTDNFPARYLINDACVMLHRPDVYASIFRFDGQASVFDADRGPCYRCLFPEPPPPDTVQDCAVAGVLGVLPGVMGSILAAQAINLIIGHGRPLVGRLLLFSATDMTFNELRIGKNRGCPVCGNRPTITKLIDYEEFCGTKRASPRVAEVDATTLKRLMDSGSEIKLLDVREPYEYELCHLPGSKLIPLGELEKRVGELDPADEIVVYCQVGARSARAVELLSSKGFKRARNLMGGIRAWADSVDPKMPVY
ncbi:MAG TPA: molybdopterin-synthase adenylyltransferase MoeB [Nitrososphaerales archaeon]|nr:molybdopterin-synthase adenylyltransferase MoeB [Nitrososphaerales archaeon]